MVISSSLFILFLLAVIFEILSNIHLQAQLYNLKIAHQLYLLFGLQKTLILLLWISSRNSQLGIEEVNGLDQCFLQELQQLYTILSTYQLSKRSILMIADLNSIAKLASNCQDYFNLPRYYSNSASLQLTSSSRFILFYFFANSYFLNATQCRYSFS